jgi:uncharacterized cupin superfamily protein
MPDVTVKRVEDFEAIFGGGFRRVRAGLGVTSFGIAVMDLPPNFDVYPEHDQRHDDQEEVYTVLSGRVTLRVGGEDHELEPGVFARVGAAEKRKLITGEEPARILAMGATPGKVYDPPEFTYEGSTPPRMEELASKTHADSATETGRPPRGAEAPPRRGRPGGYEVAQARDDRPGYARVLVPRQVGGRGELVGDRDHGGGELTAAGVAAAAPVRQRLDSRAADRHVRLSQPPRPAEAVGDNDRRA